MADEGLSLKDALGMFVQGTRDLATSKALTEANERVQQIKMSGIKDADQRMALGQIAQNLVTSMISHGASAAQVDQARMNFTPKSFQSADQARLEGIMSGNQGLVQAADQADRESVTSNIQLLSAQEGVRTRATKEQESFRERMQERLFNQQEKLKEMDLKRAEFKLAKKKNEELKQAQIDFETNAAAALRNLDALKDTVSGSGNYESNSTYNPFSNKEASADLSQNFLDTAIAYAKIVDPTSVAREGEVETAKKYAIPAGFDVSNKTTLQAIKKMKEKIIERMKDRRKLSLMDRQGLADLGADPVDTKSQDTLNLKSFIRPKR
jgi:hypothetical protein